MEPGLSHSEKIPFNPDRPPLSPETVENKRRYRDVYLSILGIPGRQAEKGQLLGKMSLRRIEGAPMDEQIDAIAEMDLLHDLLAKNGIETNGFVAGYKGEFAAGVILDHAGLKVEYPTSLEDLRQQTDLVARFNDGITIHVQVKTISLPDTASRENLGQNAPPVMSLIRNPDEVKHFNAALNERLISPKIRANRITEIKGTADLMQESSQKHGFIPVICVLGSPESDGSDIFKISARPTKIAENQALAELQNIHTQLLKGPRS